MSTAILPTNSIEVGGAAIDQASVDGFAPCWAAEHPQFVSDSGITIAAATPGLYRAFLLAGYILLDLQVDMRVYAARVSSNYKIKDIADRSGFSAATLRYYEQIGLLPESARTSAGYRMYDDHTLDRLAFISRAKQLGCSLEEIADLTVAWNGGSCGPVQDRLRAIVADKLATAQQQIIELITITTELQRAASMLEAGL